MAAIAETAVIAANRNSDSPLAQTILSKLVVHGSPERIHISPVFLLGTFLAAFGGYIRYACYRELGSMFTFEMSIRKDHRLVTTGPYGVVRHPGYFGGLCAILGIVLWHGAAVSCVVKFQTTMNYSHACRDHGQESVVP